MRFYLTETDLITPYENNLVKLERESGETYEGLEPRRLFPISRLENYITLLNADGEEIAIIKDFSDLNAASQETIRASLADYYLVPRITKIIAITEKYGTLRWEVETDRGTKSFDIRNRNHDIKVQKNGSVRVRDAHSRAQLIADL